MFSVLQKRKTFPALVVAALLIGLMLVLFPRGAALNAEGATHGDPIPSEQMAGLEIERVAVELGTSPALMSQWQGSLFAVQSGLRLLVEDTEMIIVDTDGVEAQFSLRTFADGAWGEWFEIEAQHDEGPDANPGTEGADTGASAIGPIWIGSETDAVEIVLQGGLVTSVNIDKLTIDPLFADVDLQAASISSPAQSNLTADPLTANAVAQPAIKTRSDWGGGPWNNGNDACVGGPFLADNLRGLVVHHTVTTNNYSPEQVPGILRGIYYHHVNINNWCDVAYNFLIDRFGTIWQGRAGSPDQPIRGGHAKGFNNRTAGVALLGQYQGDVKRPAGAYPSQETLTSLEALASWKLSLHGVDPLGSTWLKNRATVQPMRYEIGEWVQLPTIFGHRDVGLTSCPGNRAYVNLGAMAERIAANRDIRGGGYEIPRWSGKDLGVAIYTVDTNGGMRPALDSEVPPQAASLGTAVALTMDGTPTGGYVLSTDGQLFPYGDAPAVPGRPGGASPVDLQVRESGQSGYVITADGVFHGFGGVIDRQASAGGVAGVIDNEASGYMVSNTGALAPIGATPARALKATPVGAVIDLALWSDGVSGWALDSAGNAVGFGRAGTFATNMTTTPIAVIASPTETGGWVLDNQGQLWVFGDERPPAPVSSHVGRTNTAGGAAVAWLRDPAEFQATGDGKWLVAMYRRVAGREPTVTELEGWGWRVDVRGPEQLSNALVHTDYWAGQIVEDIYSRALGRTPDVGGKQYWLEQLRDGMSQQDLGIYFYGSEEYVLRSGGNSGFVHSMYNNLLHRPADADGHKYWTDLLNQRLTKAPDVAAGFYQSLESRRDRVARLYGRLVGGNLNPDKHEAWAEILAGTDDLQFTADLISGPDFYRSAQ